MQKYYHVSVMNLIIVIHPYGVLDFDANNYYYGLAYCNQEKELIMTEHCSTCGKSIESALR